MSLILSQTVEMSPQIDHESRLKRHTAAVRANQFTVLAILQHLLADPPRASAALECLEECDRDMQIDLWSHSPSAGGIWTTWQREALHTGELGRAYETHRQRIGLPPILEREHASTES